jgi:hypothetical protein
VNSTNEDESDWMDWEWGEREDAEEVKARLMNRVNGNRRRAQLASWLLLNQPAVIAELMEEPVADKYALPPLFSPVNTTAGMAGLVKTWFQAKLDEAQGSALVDDEFSKSKGKRKKLKKLPFDGSPNIKRKGRILQIESMTSPQGMLPSNARNNK